jgi:hypothetical protein
MSRRTEFPRLLNRAWDHRQTHKPEVPRQFPHNSGLQGSFWGAGSKRPAKISTDTPLRVTCPGRVTSAIGKSDPVALD